MSSELIAALENATDENLAKRLDEIEQSGIQTLEEVERLAAVLAAYQPPPSDPDALTSSVVYTVSRLLQGNESLRGSQVRPVLMPSFAKLIEHHLSARDVEAGDLVFAAKVLSMYGAEQALPIFAQLANDPWANEDFMWSVAFSIYDKPEHPQTEALIETLNDSFPSGFAAVAYLDLVNTLCRQQGLTPHPFDTDNGRELLRTWFENRNEEEFSYAVSAAAALPFIAGDDSLFALAEAHPNQEVKLEAAWAAAKVGRESGIEILAAAAADVNQSERAVAYLMELGLEAHIPEIGKSPEFRAMAEMAAWLAHPQEFARPPSTLELYDSREIEWPPTNDRRQVYLFKYTYNDDAPPTVGLGMVGSITFALFGETTAELTPEEAYAIHCAWELQVNEDPRAPEERTIQAGLALLNFD